MRKLHDAGIAIILVGALATLTWSSAAQAEVGQQVTAQGSPQPSPAPQQQAAPRHLLADLVDAVDANSSLLNQAAVDATLLNRLMRGGRLTTLASAAPAAQPSPQPGQQQAPPVDAIYLLDHLNASEQQQARELLNNSDYLVRNARLAQAVARRNPELRSFFQRNNIPLDRLWALDIVGQPTTVYVWASSPAGQGAPSANVPRPASPPAAPPGIATSTPGPAATSTPPSAAILTPTPATTAIPAATATPEATATLAATATPEATATPAPETTGETPTPAPEATPTP